MRKRTRFLVITIAAILALTIGLTTTAFAWGPSGEKGGGMQTFISKVAGILGLQEEQVADAFKQARQEMQDEALEQRLQKAVENGRITEEEADQIRGWWQDRPEALEKFGSPGRLQSRNAWFHQQLPGVGLRQLPSEARHLAQIFDERLEGTITDVTEGTITLAIEGGGEVTVEYTSNTTFVLRGATALEEGQTATALCWEDAEGDLTAKVVWIGSVD